MDKPPAPETVVDDAERKGCAYVSKEGGDCQFTLPAHELVLFDDKHWCPFHLPMNIEGKRTQKASWEEAKLKTFNRAIFDLIEDAKQKNSVADFTGVVFPGTISFEHFTAERPLPTIRFMAATFSGDARFDNATFSGDAGFENATFDGYARFENATFSRRAAFDNATFAEKRMRLIVNPSAGFSKAKFSSDASFDNATFSGDMSFYRTTFSGDAAFLNATFRGHASFLCATFGHNADFSCSPATSKASSDIALGHDAFGHLDFEDATFDGRAIFTNRKFTQPADFRGGHFRVAPRFYGCALHQGTSFLGRKFLGTGERGAVSAYRTLKLAMESLRDRPNEAMFFKLEQLALRTTKQASRLVRLFSLLYSVSSDYGQSIGRPLSWLALTTLVSFFVYAWLLDVTVQDVVSREALERILRVTLEPLVNPFGAFRPSAAAYPFGVQLLMLLQSLLSLVWIALFLLALRRHFKLD